MTGTSPKDSEMEYRPVGKSGLKVSQVSLGTNNFGRQVDEQTTMRIVKKAVDLGINSIDGADIYTAGKSEELIGKAVHGDRNRMVIATKVGSPFGQGPNESGLSRKHIVWALSESLRRLQTDYVDIYYMHRYDPLTPIEETLRTFDYLIREGKILHLACSNFTVQNIRDMNEVSDRLGLERIMALQPPYNLVNRDVERDLLPFCLKERLGVITYSPLMGGFLTGKYKEGVAPPAGTRGASTSYFWDRANKPENFAFLSKLNDVAASADVRPTQLAINWLLKNTAVTSIVLGASRPEQVEENVRMAESKAPEEILMSLDALSPVQAAR
jgi:aryl-alcohol dehydrogenase-like predicted oxidoreductase